jgi:hypothetical protein
LSDEIERDVFLRTADLFRLASGSSISKYAVVVSQKIRSTS